MTKYDMVWHDKAGYGMAKEYFESMAQYNNKEGNGVAGCSLWPPNHPWRQQVDVAVFNQDVEVETMIRIAAAVDILSILCYHDVI